MAGSQHTTLYFEIFAIMRHFIEPPMRDISPSELPPRPTPRWRPEIATTAVTQSLRCIRFHLYGRRHDAEASFRRRRQSRQSYAADFEGIARIAGDAAIAAGQKAAAAAERLLLYAPPSRTDLMPYCDESLFSPALIRRCRASDVTFIFQAEASSACRCRRLPFIFFRPDSEPLHAISRAFAA